jgi:hypothetical protein
MIKPIQFYNAGYRDDKQLVNSDKKRSGSHESGSRSTKDKSRIRLSHSDAEKFGLNEHHICSCVLARGQRYKTSYGRN